jgi:hypothetical protein
MDAEMSVTSSTRVDRIVTLTALLYLARRSSLGHDRACSNFDRDGSTRRASTATENRSMRWRLRAERFVLRTEDRQLAARYPQREGAVPKWVGIICASLRAPGAALIGRVLKRDKKRPCRVLGDRGLEGGGYGRFGAERKPHFMGLKSRYCSRKPAGSYSAA